MRVAEPADFAAGGKGLVATQAVAAGAVLVQETPLAVGASFHWPALALTQSLLAKGGVLRERLIADHGRAPLPRGTLTDADNINQLRAYAAMQQQDDSGSVRSGSGSGIPSDLLQLYRAVAAVNLPLDDAIAARMMALCSSSSSGVTEMIAAAASGDREAAAEALELVGSPMAVGIYETLRWVNHSCVPNAKVVSLGLERGGEKQLVALRPIAEGEHVCISYMHRASRTAGDSMRADIEAEFGFRCCCPACR